jgi:hypothetical protein
MKRLSRSGSPIVALVLTFVIGATGAACRPAAAQTNAPTTEAEITRLTTGILEHSQFAHRPFDAQLASTFLDRYGDSLDGTRSLFLQPDIDDLATYRSTLAEATRDSGDTRVAQVVFQKYIERLSQENAYVADMLRTSSFDFTGRRLFLRSRARTTT